MQAIIMAGGEGERLRPLTCDCPKPMARVCGRPVMEYALRLLKAHGVTAAGVTLKYLPEEKQRRIANGARLYLMARGWLNREVRFDLVEINRESILHIPNAFQPGGMFYH